MKKRVVWRKTALLLVVLLTFWLVSCRLQSNKSSVSFEDSPSKASAMSQIDKALLQTSGFVSQSQSSYLSSSMTSEISQSASPSSALSNLPSQDDDKITPLSDKNTTWLLNPAFSDEFNGTTLNLSKWNNDINDWGLWSWDPKNTALSEGTLKVSMQYEPHIRDGKQLFFTSGAIRSRQPVLYGYFEVRFRANERFPGVCPAFWLYTSTPSKWTEIDVVELYSRSWELHSVYSSLHVFLHPDLSSPIHDSPCAGGIYPDLDFRKDFYVYGCEWSESEIKFYFNGVLIGSRKNTYWHQPLSVIFSMGVRSPQDSSAPESTGYPTTTEVDYIRVWQKG